METIFFNKTTYGEIYRTKERPYYVFIDQALQQSVKQCYVMSFVEAQSLNKVHYSH
jgi:hypothetical protein